MKKELRTNYRADCGFRKHGFCRMKPHQCNSPKDKQEYLSCCDLYDLEYDYDKIISRYKDEVFAINDLNIQARKLRKAGDKAKAKMNEQIAKDKLKGLALLKNAATRIKRTGANTRAKMIMKKIKNAQDKSSSKKNG